MQRQVTAFVVGLVLGAVLLGGGAYLYGRLGLIDPRADIPVPRLERRIAGRFLHASLHRWAPDVKNPVAGDEANLAEGMKLYQTQCAGCHGDIDHPESDSAKSFYPRPPQFMHEEPDMPDNHHFFLIKNGIRLSGMPAFEHSMTDEKIWRVVAFLSKMNNLPPQMQQQWKELAK